MKRTGQDIGAPYRLPMRVAIQVALTSIRVRLSRSLVTVSSIVLAVAFLLTVAGEAVVVRAVHGGWMVDTAPDRALALARAALERPRDPVTMLSLVVDPAAQHHPWLTGQGVSLNDKIPALTGDLLVLERWIRRLKPAQAYLLVRTQSPLAWVLTLDQPGQLVHLLNTTKGFSGVLLPLDESRLQNLATHMSTLRGLVGSLVQAEDQRLTQVNATGGPEALWTYVVSATASLSALSARGLPSEQFFTGISLTDLQGQVVKDQTVAVAARAIAGIASSGTKASFSLPLVALARGEGGSAALAQRTALANAVRDVPALAADLMRREDLHTTEATLKSLAFDPEDGMTRTYALIGLSLLVCIVGIVNTMLMAVTERFREIATMKCLGAPDGFILRIFLVESVFLGVVGSFFGLLVGCGLVVLQASWRFGAAFWQVFPLGDLALVAGIAVLSGLVLAVFGALLPATTAARMHPIEAMRVEQ